MLKELVDTIMFKMVVSAGLILSAGFIVVWVMILVGMYFAPYIKAT